MANLRSSLAVILSQSYINIGIQFVVSIVVARLLTPSDIGVFSVAMVVIAIGNSLRDFGAGDYVVQVKDLSNECIRSVSALSIIMAWGLGAVIYSGSGTVALFYQEDGVRQVLELLTINFILLPFGTPVMAFLRRQMEFRLLAMIRIGSTLIYATVTIVLALKNHGFMSMVWGSIASTIFNVAAAQFNRPSGFPFMPGFSDIKNVFSFGLYHSTTTIMSDLGKGAPDLVLGRILGMEAVAFFGRALGLLEIFNRLVMDAVNFVALPHLSSLHREGKSLADGYLFSLSYMTVLAWPFFSFLGVMSFPVIRVLYGEQWDASARLLSYLSLGEISLAPFLILTSVLVSAGHIAIDTKRNMLIMSLKLIALFSLASLGLEILAVGYVLASFLGAFYSFYIARKLLLFSRRQFFDAIQKSIIVTFAASLGPLAVVLVLGVNQGVVVQLIAALVLAMAGWLGAVYYLRHPMRSELGKMVKYLNGLTIRGS